MALKYRSPAYAYGTITCAGRVSLRLKIGLGRGLPRGADLTVAGDKEQSMVIERLGTRFMAVGRSREVPLIEGFFMHGKYMENIPFHARRPL